MSTVQTSAGPAWLVPVVSAHLRPGEILLASATGRLDGLLPELPRSYLPGREVGQSTSARILGVLIWCWPPTWLQWCVDLLERRAYPAMRRRIHGGAWSGGWESEAGRLLVTYYLSAKEPPAKLTARIALAVTSERFLLLSCTPVRDEPYLASLVFELPRGAFCRRRDPHPERQRYRLDLEFGDGSWLAFGLSEKSMVPPLAAPQLPVGLRLSSERVSRQGPRARIAPDCRRV